MYVNIKNILLYINLKKVLKKILHKKLQAFQNLVIISNVSFLITIIGADVNNNNATLITKDIISINLIPCTKQLIDPYLFKCEIQKFI